ncbi:hypothetical protein ABFP60_10420 [Clostridioides difficile]
MTIFSFLIIACLLLLNFYLYKKNFISKNLFYISTSFIVLYIIIAISVFYNNIANDFSTGILFGDVENNHFCDEYKYNIDSQILLNHFKNGEFSQWLHKELPLYEFVDPQGHPSYGNYNIFVIMLTLLRMIGVNSPLDFILIKLFIYIPTYIYLFKLSKIYLNEKLSLISVALFSILPGYILTNSLLMRDNIILFLMIVALYYILSKNYNFKILIPILILLLFFRSYLIPIFIATIIFTYKNNKKIISVLDFIYIGIIIGTIYFFTNYNFNLEHSNIFFSFYQIQALQDNFVAWYGTGIPMLLKLFFLTAIQIILDPLFINFLSSGLIYLWLTSVGNIIGIFVSISFSIIFLVLCFTNKDSKIKHLQKFTFYFTLLNALLLMSKDSYIINRLALMWLPLFIIILLIPFNRKRTS